MSDEAERKAGEVLPCNSPYELRKCWDANNHIRDICPAYYRPAVAALLREREAEIAKLKSEVIDLKSALDTSRACTRERDRHCTELRAELSSLRSRLGEAEKSAQDQIDLYAAGEAQAKREAVESKRLLEGREAQVQAARVEALRDLDIEIDTLPFATDADSALSFKYRVKSRIAAMIDAEEKKARDV